jgi:predicted AAA+ superfamily ATPase
MAVMFSRNLTAPKSASFFLLGPRGTGKSTWLRSQFPTAYFIDLLDYAVYTELLAHPDRLEALIGASDAQTVILDEVQRLPGLLDEVHRLIEKKKLRFVLTGSSARKLRRGGVNLLAGRARTCTMHPLTAAELGPDFDLRHSLTFGQLPSSYVSEDPSHYLRSYVGTYLREEVQAEALVRNLETFSRFLSAASFSQASVLNIAEIARELGLARKTVEGYFDLLDDLLLGVRLPVFSRRAKRALSSHAKFYFFDAGVYRALRPKGPLDTPEEVDGGALETLVMQELRATNDNLNLGYQVSFWRTRDHKEVDFVLYGERGLTAIEVKRGAFRSSDLATLRLFRSDYPMAKCFLFSGSRQRYDVDGIHVLPVGEALPRLGELLA